MSGDRLRDGAYAGQRGNPGPPGAAGKDSPPRVKASQGHTDLTAAVRGGCTKCC